MYAKCVTKNIQKIHMINDLLFFTLNQGLITFISDNDFINIIKSNTCFKTSTGTYIDLILTNKPKRFQNRGVIEIGVSDHHLLIFSFFKTSFTKMSPNKLRYRKYKSFDKIRFLKDVSKLPEKTNS